MYRTLFLVIITTIIFGNLYAQEPEISATTVRKNLKPFMQLLVDKESSVQEKKDDLILLGKTLFYDNRLSADNKFSCNSCHDLEKYGTNGAYYLELKEQGKFFRDVPSIYNLKNLEFFGWASESKKMTDKIRHSLSSPHEMNFTNSDDLIKKITTIPGYEKLFQKAFQNEKEPLNINNLSIALQEFINGLITPAPIDKFLAGDDTALTQKQLSGAVQFDKNNCFSCHTGSTFGGQMIMKLGVLEEWPNQTDKGYSEISKDPKHAMTFRVSPLRNVEKTAPYFHDGSSNKMWDAIGKMGRYELGKEFSLEEKHLLQEFLKSFTGEIPVDYIKKPEMPN